MLDTKTIWMYKTPGDFVLSLPDEWAAQYAERHPDVIVFEAVLTTKES